MKALVMLNLFGFAALLVSIHGANAANGALWGAHSHGC
jgi:hypothetical protein